MYKLNEEYNYLYYKTGEIADQFRLFWFSNSPKLICNFAHFVLRFMADSIFHNIQALSYPQTFGK